MATILMLDDEPFVMNATAGILRDAGFSVHTCDSWAEIVGMIRRTSPQLILVDYNMPGVKGDDVCSALKKNLPQREVKIVLFSSEDEDRLRALVETCGADGFLSKTRGQSHIVEGVQSFLM